MSDSACTHIREAKDIRPRTPDGCEECLAAGDEWVALRVCLACGHVGCCDSSKNRHATKHYQNTQHPVIASYEPGQAWRWCYPDQQTAQTDHSLR